MNQPDIALLGEIKELILKARSVAARQINSLQVLTNFEIGRRIVEEEQRGSHRAEYGIQLVRNLALALTKEFGSGFSKRNLDYMRKFFLLYSERSRHIVQTPFAQSRLSGIVQTVSAQSTNINKTGNGDSPPEKPAHGIPVFALSWSHYIFLLGIKSSAERQFYEIEATQGSWTLSELRRQFDSGLFERLALARKPQDLSTLAQNGHVISKPADLVKDPYVLEFLGIAEQASYSESELETAIISKIEDFLLELGKGFLFEARQKRFTFEEEHFFVDLVFYNRLLRCYVLIDLKIGKLTHQDLGQMQMYVNYFDRFVKTDSENATIGIILCKKKTAALVEITLPKDANIHAAEYQLYLPSKEELQQRLIEWTQDQPA